MAFNVIANLTDQARQRIAQMLKTGKSFQVTHFSVSDGGHNLGDPLVALAPDPSDVVPPTNGFDFGPTAITSAIMASAFCPQYTCTLESGDANGPLSSLQLHATIVYSPISGDPDVSQKFLFAIGNFPLKVKTMSDTFQFNVLVQL